MGGRTRARLQTAVGCWGPLALCEHMAPFSSWVFMRLGILERFCEAELKINQIQLDPNWETLAKQGV